MEFTKEMELARRMVEDRLTSFFPGGGLEEAMRYSLLAGGKRIRPILTMKFCQAAGGTPEEALEWLRNNMMPYYPLGVYQDRTANEKGVF